MLFLAASVVFTMNAAGKQNVIGSTDLPTFLFVLFNAKNGWYAAFAVLGCAGLFTAILTRLIKKKA